MAITIDTLGRLRVSRDGEEISSLPRQPVRCALLLFLTVEGETTRDAAMGMLWPDKDPDRARGALHQTLYELRKVLGDDWVHAQGDFLRGADDVTVDAVGFEALVEAGDFEKALELYGGPFLAGSGLSVGSEFEHWCERKNTRLATLHRKARRGQLEDLYDADERVQALTVAQAWWELDPLEDEAAHWVIRLLAELGHQSQALQTYDRHAAALWKELEVAPLDETQELVRQVREGEMAGEGHLAQPEAKPEGRLLRFGRLRPAITPAQGGRWLAVLAGTLALLWTIGFLTTRAYDVRTGMPAEYMPSQADFLRVGLGALVPSLFAALVALMAYLILAGAYTVLSLALHRLTRFGPRLDSWSQHRRERWRDMASALTPATIGHGFFFLTLALSCVVLYAFRDMIASLWVSDAAVVSSARGSLQAYYVLVMTLLVMGLLLAWRGVFGHLVSRGGGQVGVARWGTLAWIVVLVLIMTMPWRLHWEEHPRVLLEGARAYVLAETDVEVVLFRPSTGQTLRLSKERDLDIQFLGSSGVLFESQREWNNAIEAVE